MTKKLTLLMVSMAGILAILVTPTSMANAYTCSSSSSTHNVKIHSGVTGSSGSCASSSSATATSGPNGSTQITASGPPGFADGQQCLAGGGTSSCSATASGQTASGAQGLASGGTSTVVLATIPGSVVGVGAASSSPSGVQSTSSTSAGGSQSSCSSSSGTAATGSTSSTSTSKPGSCP